MWGEYWILFKYSIKYKFWIHPVSTRDVCRYVETLYREKRFSSHFPFFLCSILPAPRYILARAYNKMESKFSSGNIYKKDLRNGMKDRFHFLCPLFICFGFFFHAPPKDGIRVERVDTVLERKEKDEEGKDRRIVRTRWGGRRLGIVNSILFGWWFLFNVCTGGWKLKKGKYETYRMSQ